MIVENRKVSRFADLDAGEPLDAQREMVLGIGPVDNPPARFPFRCAEANPKPALRLVGIEELQPDEVKLGGGRENRPGRLVVSFKSKPAEAAAPLCRNRAATVARSAPASTQRFLQRQSTGELFMKRPLP